MNADQYYPQMWDEIGSFSLPDSVDSCMGAPDSQSVYHYRAMPPCIYNRSIGVASLTSCTKNANCNGNGLNYALNSFPRNTSVAGIQVMGLAKDGHLIYSPISSNGNVTHCYQLDMCNGRLMTSGDYAYFMTNYFPYTVGCWGPAMDQKYVPSCTINACFGVINESLNFMLLGLTLMAAFIGS